MAARVRRAKRHEKIERGTRKKEEENLSRKTASCVTMFGLRCSRLQQYGASSSVRSTRTHAQRSLPPRSPSAYRSSVLSNPLPPPPRTITVTVSLPPSAIVHVSCDAVYRRHAVHVRADVLTRPVRHHRSAAAAVYLRRTRG
jgi:hypothetical protein